MNKNSYCIYLAAHCSCATDKGRWASITFPDYDKWTVELGGKSGCKDTRRMYLTAAIAAMDDLTMRSEIGLYVDDYDAFSLLEQIATGQSPRIGSVALLDALGIQLDRHNVTLALTDASDLRMQMTKELLESQLRK